MKHLNIEVHESRDNVNLDVSSGEAALPSNILHATAIPETPIKALSWVYKIEKFVIFFLRWGAVLLSLALGLLMAAQVLMRYVLHSPFLGIEELAPMLGLWIYFLGISNATRERDHITGGILTLVFTNKKLICSIRIIGTILCIIATIVFGYYAQKHAWFNMSIGRKSPYMGFSKGFWDFSMVVGFILTGFYFILQVIAELRQFVTIPKTKENLQ